MDILIAGGGIGGLTAALCLARQHHKVTLFEQASEISEVGAGLQIGANGMKVLRALGLESAIEKLAFEPEKIDLRFGKSGRTIFEIPLGETGKTRWGAPYYQMHRADLLSILLEAASQNPNIAFKTDARVTGYNQTPDGISINFEAGTTLSGDLLIGADGIHSVIRDQMHGPEAPDFMGCVAWRGVVPFERLTAHPTPPNATAWVGKGKHAVTYRLRRGELVNFVGVVEQKAFQRESWTSKGAKAQLAEDFAGWHPAITEIITQGEEFFQWGLFGREGVESWYDGRVVLLGDAVHPTLPFLAQGAVMAIEDAFVLAECLSDPKLDTDEALRTYQTLREPFTSKIQSNSLRNKSLFHLRHPALRAGVYGGMMLGGTFAQDVVTSRMDWIYGQDVTGTKKA